MSLSIYKVEQTHIPYSGELGEKELNFLDNFHNENDDTFYVEGNILDDVIKGYARQNKADDIPWGLVKFLREIIVKEGSFWFVVT